MKVKLDRNYKSTIYSVEKSKMIHVQNDYQILARDNFNRKIDDILMDIEQALNP